MNRIHAFCYSTLLAFSLLILLGGSLSAEENNHVSASEFERLGISRYAATAGPILPRPRTTPCEVELFRDVSFKADAPHSFEYTPPRNCLGPWGKVVLSADFNVTAGRQFDRTAQIWIGGTSVYFGTTQEPSKTVAPAWHVDRDLTEYSALFTAEQSGRVELANVMDTTYTGLISGSARLLFYPLDHSRAKVQTADAVLPLTPSPGGTAKLVTAVDKLEREFSLPRNIERVYLDVYPQSQKDDEFWYTCVPSEFAKKLDTCGGTSFRETEIRIDDQPAGVVPVYPWIFTGGIDPLLWRPLPAIQALRFEPYRVDLTPFAGLLSDGKPHRVAVSVFNVSNYFSLSATLLLYLDHGSQQVTGAVTFNSLAPNTQVRVQNNIRGGADAANGTLVTSSSRGFRIAGYVNTSHGRIETELEQTIAFRNHQDIQAGSAEAIQNITQTTSIRSTTTTHSGGQVRVETRQAEYPLIVSTGLTTSADKSRVQKTEVHQSYTVQQQIAENGFPLFLSILSHEMNTADNATFDADGKRTGSTGQAAWQKYAYSDSDGRCYRRTIKADKGEITEVQDGCRAE